MELNKIEQIAREYHQGQKRWNGDDYITHPLRISRNMPDDFTKSIALLHDTLEDTKATRESLLEKGVSKEVVNAVEILTKRNNQKYLNYIRSISESKNNAAMYVKIGDLRDNLSDLHNKDKIDKYELSLYILETKLKEIKNE